ncbi:MAG: HAMP domain-containing protein, partial [Mycobacterium sp.]
MTKARRFSIQYAAGLAFAHLLAVGDAAAIVIPLHDRIGTGAYAYFSVKNMLIAAALIVVGAVAVAVGGAVILAPALRWFVRGQQPDKGQRRTAMRLVRRQSLILAATWAASGVIFLALNLDGGITLAAATLLAVVFGGSAAASISLLVTQRTIRPILVAASQGSEGAVIAPRVLTRLVGMWLMGSGLPCAAIAALVVIRSNGWIIQKTASVEMPILVVVLAAVLLGLPTMILTSRSISDPIGEVVDAMAQVQQGRIDASVGVYERSEIGRLQSGFNRMVTGIAERDRLRDLFGRHVGVDVARRAVEEGTSLSGDVGEAAILFIDLVDSTKLAASRP